MQSLAAAARLRNTREQEEHEQLNSSQPVSRLAWISIIPASSVLHADSRRNVIAPISTAMMAHSRLLPDLHRLPHHSTVLHCITSCLLTDDGRSFDEQMMMMDDLCTPWE